MKKFLLKISVAFSLALLVHFVASFCAGGKTDAYYLRFTGAPQKSMIIGTSRAAQGMVPAEFNQVISEQGYEGPMYNFAFTSLTSPYGEVYYHAITEKLDSSAHNGLFLVTVEPYSFCIPTYDSTGKKPQLPELSGALYDTHFFNTTPNYEYLLHNYCNGWGHLMLEKYNLTKNEMVLQKDGWLEVNVPMDSMTVAKRAKGKIMNHKKSVGQYAYSPMRMEYFEKTVNMLKKHGRVFIVRLPVSKPIYDIEDEILPGFDQIVIDAAKKLGVPYNNMNGARDLYQYKDGHHIGRASAFECSDSLARWVASFHSVEYP